MKVIIFLLPLVYLGSFIPTISSTDVKVDLKSKEKKNLGHSYPIQEEEGRMRAADKPKEEEGVELGEGLIKQDSRQERNRRHVVVELGVPGVYDYSGYGGGLGNVFGYGSQAYNYPYSYNGGYYGNNNYDSTGHSHHHHHHRHRHHSHHSHHSHSDH